MAHFNLGLDTGYYSWYL